jgi:hypothetical protein
LQVKILIKIVTLLEIAFGAIWNPVVCGLNYLLKGYNL